MTSDKYIPGVGNSQPRIVFVGESPSYDELTAGKPFVGPSGKFLDQCLSVVGINRNEQWVTNVCKYFVLPSPSNSEKKIPFKVRASQAGIDLNKCVDELRTEINQLQPNIIVPLGGTALWAVTGKNKIQEWRGSIIQGMGFKCVATYHPAHILHQEGDIKGYWNKQVMLFDLKRALAQSLYRDFRLPRRSLNVCTNSAQFADFIRRNECNSFPSIDIEAHGTCVPICVGISFDKSEGITVPLWNHNSLSDIPTSDLTSIWILLSEFLARHKVIGQNFGYDRDKLLRLGFRTQLHSDTMLKAFTINPELPKNLAFNTSIYTEEPFYKNEGMYEGSINDLLIGCARDACVTKEIDLAMDADLDQLNLREYYEQFILPLHDLYAYIESNGLRTDETMRRALIHKYVERYEHNAHELFQLAGEPINIDSPKQVAKLLYNDWKIPERKGTGEEVLTQLLNNVVRNVGHKRGINLILEGRQLSKTIGNYLVSPTDFDGRTRTSYFICLETGRSSTNQQEPPIRPSFQVCKWKGTKGTVSMGMAFQTITKHGDIGSDVRKMFVPDEGEIFIQADSSQAEARVIFLLAEDYQALKDIDEHDYHALTASWFFGGREEDYSKKTLGYESPIRFAGKTLRHAGHLGASKRRASIEINTQARKYKIDYTISEATADKALKIFHAKQPKIKQVFQAGVIECLTRDRRLIAPVPYGIDAQSGGNRLFMERWSDELFRQAFSYLPQRTVSENTKAAALRIRTRANWIKILVEAHDALLCSVPDSRLSEAAQILKEEFERPLNFSKCSLSRGELVIPCELETGMNYQELSKFKWLAV